jgi:hypothetical protein
MNDERLRQILRQGDPAGEDGGLTPDEAHAMRRTVLTAVPERKRRLLPVFALAGAAALAALIAILLLRPEPAKAPVPPRTATVLPAPQPAPIAQIPAEPAPRPSAREEERRPVHRHRQHHPRPPASPEIHDTVASLETARPERQVQFSTPGGTRIIWILKSGKDSR